MGNTRRKRGKTACLNSYFVVSGTQQSQISSFKDKSRAQNTRQQYNGIFNAFKTFLQRAEISYNEQVMKINDIDCICHLLVAGIVAFLKFASNNSTLRPGTLNSQRSAISKYYRGKGHGDECYLNGQGQIVGNPTRQTP